MTDAALTPAELVGDYRFDPAHTTVGFVARHAMVTKVRGHFAEFDGSVHIDRDLPKSSIRVVIKADSISTGQEMRDAHLRSNDFFAMEDFPEITFESTAVGRAGDTTVRITGDLTIRGVTKSITFDLDYTGAVRDPMGIERRGFEGSTVINRKDWGVNWNAPLEAGGVLVSEKVTLEFDVSALKIS